MSPSNSEETTSRLLSLDERKGLVWIRKHQPVEWRASLEGAPSHRTLVALLQAGLIGLPSERKRFDPVAYALTPKGVEALGP